MEGRGGPDLSGLEGRLAEMEGRKVPEVDIDAIRRQVQEGWTPEGVDLSGIEGRLAEMAELQGRGGPDLSGIETRLAEMEGRGGPDLSGIEGRLAEMEGRGGPDLSSIEKSIAELQGRGGPDLSGIETRLAEMEGKGAPDLSGLEGKIADLQKRFSTPPKGTGGVKPSKTPTKTASPGITYGEPPPPSRMPPAPWIKDAYKGKPEGWTAEPPPDDISLGDNKDLDAERFLSDVKKLPLFQKGDGTVEYNPETGKYILDAFGMKQELTAAELAKKSELDLSAYGSTPSKKTTTKTAPARNTVKVPPPARKPPVRRSPPARVAGRSRRGRG